MSKRDVDYSLYMVASSKFSRNGILEDIEAAVKQGVTVVQLREKEMSSRAFFELAGKVKEVTDYYDVPLLVNDRVDIAMAVNCSGVHIGQKDLPLAVVRQMLGEEKIIGLTVRNEEQYEEIGIVKPDYIGSGAVYATNTKLDTQVIGVKGIERMLEVSEVPLVAIGGLSAENILPVIALGVGGLAFSSAFYDQSDVALATSCLRERILQGEG